MSLAIGNHRLPVSDETWPYPDREGEPEADDELDLDLLELRADPRAYGDLSPHERHVLFLRFGLGDGVVHSLFEIAETMGVSHAEATGMLDGAITKLRVRLIQA
ncbi:MAG: hypothetical protein ACRDY7_09325 [Acidimicrobiia bacterium]